MATGAARAAITQAQAKYLSVFFINYYGFNKSAVN
jgi:hypothetical protein